MRERREKPTQDELRDRVLDNGKQLAFGQGKWREYDEGAGIWCDAEEDIILKRVMTVVEAAKQDGIDPTFKLIKDVAGMTRIKAAVREKEWDSDPDKLVCGNGVLHIPTRRLTDHSPHNFATSAVPYAYDPKAVAPAWTRFVSEVFEPEIAAFLQEFVGLALTPDQSQEVTVWLWAPPGSGKSTFLAGVNGMLGDRAGELGLRELQRSRFSLATLPGKTLVTATEQPSGFLSCTDLINKIVSGDPIQVEKKHKDPVDITPRCKVLWAMNERPRVYEADNGLFRRLALVKMAPIPPEAKDPKIRLDVENEGPGILNWALDGLARYRGRGRLEIPAGVAENTNEFSRFNDVPRQFLEEWCEYDPARKDEPDMRTRSRTLYSWYEDFCKATGHRPKSENTISEDWLRLGLTKIMPKNVKTWKGVKVPKGQPD